MAAAESRAAQINPDRFWVGILAIVLVTIIMLASYIFSFAAIAEAGGWTGVPLALAWLAAVFIDGPILTYTVSLVILERRAESRRGLRRTRFFLYAFTCASVVLNFAHTGSYWQWDYTKMEAWFGALMAVAAPLAALASSEEVVRLAFAKPKSGGQQAAADDVIAGAVTRGAPTRSSTATASFDSLERELAEIIHPVDYTLAIESRDEVGSDVHDALRG
ncbi:DUF2637 domain-containing protein [Microbacterium gorillae]|uniref:DUF2637 domain-containing protein n=1 Tax=Microbacterium gorillae TaxID=1231063 RepID=UPI003D950FA0